MKIRFTIFILCCSVFISCGHYISETGKASYYADKFEGRKTASGAVFHQHKKTGAHRTLPFGTKVKVTNVETGKKIKVRINDRGPFVQGRIIDLSRKAAEKIDMIKAGVMQVTIRYKKQKS